MPEYSKRCADFLFVCALHYVLHCSTKKLTCAGILPFHNIYNDVISFLSESLVTALCLCLESVDFRLMKKLIEKWLYLINKLHALVFVEIIIINNINCDIHVYLHYLYLIADDDGNPGRLPVSSVKATALATNLDKRIPSDSIMCNTSWVLTHFSGTRLNTTKPAVRYNECTAGVCGIYVWVENL